MATWDGQALGTFLKIERGGLRLKEMSTQADVLMNESVLDGPSLESGEKEGSLGESNAEALMLVRTEAGRHDVSNEELQPSDGNPPLGMKGTLENDAPRKKPVRKPREEQLVGTTSGTHCYCNRVSIKLVVSFMLVLSLV